MSRLREVTCHILSLFYRFKKAFTYMIPTELHDSLVRLGTSTFISYPNEKQSLGEVSDLPKVTWNSNQNQAACPQAFFTKLAVWKTHL